MCDACQLLGFDADVKTGEPFTQPDQDVFINLLDEMSEHISSQSAAMAAMAAMSMGESTNEYDRFASICITFGCGALVAHWAIKNGNPFDVESLPPPPFDKEYVDDMANRLENVAEGTFTKTVCGQLFHELRTRTGPEASVLFLIGFYLVRTRRYGEYINVMCRSDLESLEAKLRAEAENDPPADTPNAPLGSNEDVEETIMRMFQRDQ